MLSGGVTPRLMTALAAGETRAVRTRRPSPGPKPTEDAIDRWRLATIVQHFYIGTPMTLSGDEAGMYGGPPPFASAPMWWMDLAEPASKSPDYRGDLVALVQWLHKQREKYAPLRHGGFKTVFLDAEKTILALLDICPATRSYW